MQTLTSTLITRHPVYDPTGEVFGYELVAGSPDGPPGATGLRGMGASALVQTVLSGLLDELTADERMILEVPADLLVAELAALLPAAHAVVVLPPDTERSDDLVAVLRELREAGADVMLGGFVIGDARTDLLGEVDLVGVDLTGVRHAAGMPHSGHAGGLPMLAQRIGTPEAFAVARQIGCTYFQGGIFVGTAIVEVASPPGFRPVHLALLEEVFKPELDARELERITKQDVQLTHTLLRFVNAAHFGWRRRIDSLAHAFVLLGAEKVRSWATLVVMADLAADQPQQVAVTACVRARFCELLGAQARVPHTSLELFALGMFSLIDVLVGKPMREALVELPLSPTIREALLGRSNALRHVLDVVLAYEDGDWVHLNDALAALGIGDTDLLGHYLAAVDWAAGTLDIAAGDP